MEYLLNGYDTDGIEDELEQHPNNYALIDFNEEFHIKVRK